MGIYSRAWTVVETVVVMVNVVRMDQPVAKKTQSAVRA